jgi:hypothetical protein
MDPELAKIILDNKNATKQDHLNYLPGQFYSSNSDP